MYEAVVVIQNKRKGEYNLDKTVLFMTGCIVVSPNPSCTAVPAWYCACIIKYNHTPLPVRYTVLPVSTRTIPSQAKYYYFIN
jgi:hypothetical protein